EESLGELARRHTGHVAAARGRGLVWGVSFREPGMAKRAAAEAFARGLLVETAGSHDEVMKVMPPLTITDEDLAEGLSVLQEAVTSAVGGRRTCAARTR
ncbi:aminotransferase class III-fold pyridoxal phosphate-dependent enzyme, partial [Streptomyces achromogenes]